jgi:hypothetical protein
MDLGSSILVLRLPAGPDILRVARLSRCKTPEQLRRADVASPLTVIFAIELVVRRGGGWVGAEEPTGDEATPVRRTSTFSARLQMVPTALTSVAGLLQPRKSHSSANRLMDGFGYTALVLISCSRAISFACGRIQEPHPSNAAPQLSQPGDGFAAALRTLVTASQRDAKQSRSHGRRRPPKNRTTTSSRPRPMTTASSAA